MIPNIHRDREDAVPDTDALDRAEKIGGPSEGYERPKDIPTDDDESYEEGDEEPSGLAEEGEEGGEGEERGDDQG